MAAPEGHCCICGAYGPLSFEHVPPEAAFNDQRVLLADIERLMSNPDWNDFENPRGGRFQQKGSGGYTLCGRCNSRTGHWYGNQYVSWARQGMYWLASAQSGSSLRLPYFITPCKVLKQIICLFASACGPGLMEKEVDLKRWVLNPALGGGAPGVRVYCYLMAPTSRGSRQSGITGVMKLGTGISAFAEIAYPPFGYILTIDSQPLDPELTDITFFGRFGPNEFADIYLKLPVREVNSHFPGDFRSLEQIKREYLESRATS